MKAGEPSPRSDLVGRLGLDPGTAIEQMAAWTGTQDSGVAGLKLNTPSRVNQDEADQAGVAKTA
jgi:hypothetical protein